MGDRTWVEIDVRTIDWEWIVRSCFGGDENEADISVGTDEVDECDDIMTLAALECDAGNWDELEELLHSNFCEFDKRFGHGHGYMGGKEYCRNVGGQMHTIIILDDEKELAKFLAEIRNFSETTMSHLVEARYRSLFPFEVSKLA